MPIVCSGRVFTPGTRPQGSELLTVTTRTPCPWCVVISPGPLIRSTGRAVHGVCGFELLRCPSEKQHRHFARSSFRERSHHGLASLEKSAGAIREHSKAYLCIDFRSDRNLRLYVGGSVVIFPKNELRHSRSVCALARRVKSTSKTNWTR